MIHKNKILVVEDNTNIRNTLKDILSMNGYEVLTAVNGLEGVNNALKTNPDLIISDIMMPEMDGFSFLKEIHQHLSSIPFIFLSAKSTRGDVREGMNNGADDYLTKPFSTKDLLAAVNKRLERMDTIKRQKIEQQVGLQTKAILENKNQLLSRYKNLENSILYAEDMQQKILPSMELLNQHLPDNFCIYKPKDTLSGDFYWFNHLHKNNLIAVVDCVGHGIPGAMTSMIGYSFLNRAVKEFNLTHPSKILNKLHEQFVNYIPSDKAKGFNEGMDVSLCQINKTKKELIFSGAKRPLYLIRSKNKKGVEEAFSSIERGDYILYEIKGNSYSIDASKPKNYKHHKIDIEPEDKIYLFSDGFADQFGGSRNKKIGPNRFKNLLLHIQNKEMNEQKEALEKALNKWKTWLYESGITEEQTDDILIIGIKI